MGEKIDIDGVRFKVEADLSKLDADLKKGEAQAKKGGENLGKSLGDGISSKLNPSMKKSFGSIEAEGTGAFGKIKASAANAFKSVEEVAGSSGSKLVGILGKIGAAGAIAFGVGKVIAWGKSAVESAEAADKAAGRSAESVSAKYTKASEAVAKSWDNITNAIGKALLPVAQGIYNAFAGILSAVANVSNSIAIALTNTRDALFTVGDAAKKDVNEFNKLGAGLKDLKVGTEEFGKARDSIIEQSDKLNLKIQGEIDSNEKLLAVYKKLSNAKLESLQATASTLGAEQSQLKNEFFKITGEVFVDRSKETTEQRRARLIKDREAGGAARSLTPEQRRRAAEIRAELPEISRNLDNINVAKFRLGTGFIEAEKTKPGEGGGGIQGQEERFLDSRLRLETIFQKRRETLAIIANAKISEDERERRRQNAEQSANIDARTEINALRQYYAQFIEDNTAAKMTAQKMEYDNAKRLSKELLEAQLKQAGANEGLILQAKQENEKRMAAISAATARKQAAITLQSVADNLNAAKDIAGGVNALRNSRDAGSALGATGGIVTGLSKFSPFSALKDFGPVVGAVGGVATALSSLFGKSDEDRAREAAESQRILQEQKTLLELQNSYTKNILALQEQAAKQPFEALQRKLRLIDINAQQDKLNGVDEATANANRLQARKAAIDETTRSQSGAIGGGQLFGGTDGSASGLIQFLNERGAQSVAVSQFVAGFQNISQDLANRGIGDSQIANLNYYRGRIPDAFFGPFDDFVAHREQAIAEYKRGLSLSKATGAIRSDLTNQGEQLMASAQSLIGSKINSNLGSIQGLSSEVSADTGIAESMVSLLEQSQQNELEIAANTKKTADNTTKLVDTPQRQSSIIDISRGYTRSLGQVLNPGLTNTGLPASVQAAVLATDIQKSIQERSLDKLQNIETIQRDSRELLAIIAKGVNTTASGSLLAELESLYRRSLAA
jgi:hypothetical protein